MIKISREACPQSLDKPAIEITKSDYSKQDVKVALLNMQLGKCCYCERDIRKLADSEKEVEHFRPRHLFKDENGDICWGEANRWENLLYSCGECNGRKRGKNPINDETGEIEIINPSAEDVDPEDYIGFVIDYPLFNYKSKHLFGERTIENLGLKTRTDLICSFRTMSSEIDDSFSDLINEIQRNDTIRIEVIKSDLRKTMSAHIPHAGFVRAYIRHRLGRLNNVDLPRMESQLGRNYERIVLAFPTKNEVVV